MELEAAAEATRVKLEANAKAHAIKVVSEQLAQPDGHKAMEFQLGNNYLESLTQVLPNSKLNTLFVGQDMGDLSKIVANAMGVMKGMPSTAERRAEKQ